MFIAKNSEGKRISIENATKDNQYFCPICDKPLIIKAMTSSAVRTHFAHLHKCNDDWHYEMSEWHYAWQQKFPENCREIIVKKGDEKHRADVLINNTVIEFQHSHIKPEEIIKRNNFYLSLGHEVVWVFDATTNYKFENLYEDTLDPIKCKHNVFDWKRPKQEFSQFTEKIPPNVKVYLQYSIPNTDLNIILLLTRLNAENFTFYKTTNYISQNNFLKEYGVELNNEISISDMIELDKMQHDIKLFKEMKQRKSTTQTKRQWPKIIPQRHRPIL